MEVEVVTDCVSIKAIYVKHSLDIFNRNLLNLIGFEETHPEDLGCYLRRAAKEFFDRIPSGRLQVSFESPGAKLDDYFFRFA